MKRFASYSRRFKLNFKQKKRFSEKCTCISIIDQLKKFKNFQNSTIGNINKFFFDI